MMTLSCSTQAIAIHPKSQMLIEETSMMKKMRREKKGQSPSDLLNPLMHSLPIGGYGVRLPEASSAMDLVGKTMLAIQRWNVHHRMMPPTPVVFVASLI